MDQKHKKPVPLLSKKAKEFAVLMRDNKGSFLKGHVKPSGDQCYRLMDANMNPIANVTQQKVLELCAAGFVHHEGKTLCYTGKVIN
jgi:hypothetical protein